MSAITKDFATLTRIQSAIPELLALWTDNTQSSVRSRKAVRNKMRAVIGEKVCEPLKQSSTERKSNQKKDTKVFGRKHGKFCVTEDNDPPTSKEIDNQACGAYPPNVRLLNNNNKQDRIFQYRTHPIVPTNTGVTLLYGYYAGVKDQKKFSWS